MRDGTFDVIVIGGGHAGAEAAWAAAHIGARTALVTYDLAALGRASCNPAVGGLGKGQMVREIDALGGLMGRVTDEAGIQFRMLNRRKGPAVWGPRAQIDSLEYPRVLRRYLELCPNLTLIAAGVDTITRDDDGVAGVVLDDGRTLTARAVVLSSGTFLRGLMHTGTTQTAGGRVGEAASNNLSDSLRALGLELGRLKTGTPPRVARDSVDFSVLEEQPGDAEPAPFSFLTTRIAQSQVPCWHSSTNRQIHDLIHANLARAPLYTGQIGSTGPRYCPSIETKVVRFPEKETHQVFLEPETRDGERIYVNGISTSLPVDVQREMVALLPGLAHARVVQWGYAVEYDFVPPEQIDATLMTKRVPGLFLAGQVNGTSGYEEAAGQGIMAGINAARFVAGLEAVVLRRDEAYIGVMIDDLVTRGVTEPYRMFTSRAEHRMLLRYDNADVRLTPVGRQVGLVDDTRWAAYTQHQQDVACLLQELDTRRLEGRTIREWLKRPEEDGVRFRAPDGALGMREFPERVWARALVEVKYAGYIARQGRAVERVRALETERLPADINYYDVSNLRHEARERWTAVRPVSVGQAARVSGINPTDVSVLLVHLLSLRRAGNVGVNTDMTDIL